MGSSGIDELRGAVLDRCRSTIDLGHPCLGSVLILFGIDATKQRAGDPEALSPRSARLPAIGDLVIVGGAGAYCAAMSTINYNSYPQSPEVMLESDGSLRLLRRRQDPEAVWANEIAPA